MSDGVFKPVDRIVAIGDVHADLEGLKNILYISKTINKESKWIGGNTYVVQVGDQMDGLTRMGTWNGDKEFEVILYLTELDEQAKKTGGRVLSLIGNHEFNNVLGDFSYASKNGIEQFGGSETRKKLCQPGGKVAHLFANTRYAVLKIGDWVFVHGGITPDIARNYSIHKINTMMRQFMKNKLNPDDKQHFNKVFMDNGGILYYRGYSNVKPDCGKLKETMKYFGNANMVVGHTVQDNINCKCGGRGNKNAINGSIYRIDTGISRSFGEPNYQALEILKNNKVNIIKQ